MNEVEKVRAPIWFFIVSILFLIWNLFGLAIFFLAVFVLNNEEALTEAGLNQAQVELTLATPGWVNVAFGVAVIFGVLGSGALVARRKLAIPLLAISLLGVLAQNTHMYLLSDTIETMGVGASPAVIIGAVAAVPFAMFCARKGWLV